MSPCRRFFSVQEFPSKPFLCPRISVFFALFNSLCQCFSSVPESPLTLFVCPRISIYSFPLSQNLLCPKVSASAFPLSMFSSVPKSPSVLLLYLRISVDRAVTATYRKVNNIWQKGHKSPQKEEQTNTKKLLFF